MLTDEGFYIHNARNVALYGSARTDEFNNMLLSPWLHYLQVGVFNVFGVGSIQARLISVVTSILTLCIYWATMKRVFGDRVAILSTLILGLDHTNLLFNRMALMDTPATLPLVAAFYCFVRAAQSQLESRKLEIGNWGWLVACGLLLGTTFTGRSMCAYILPAPMIAIWTWRSSDTGALPRLKACLYIAAGVAAVAIVYFGLWYLPNRTELSHMLNYYRTQQIQPHSVLHLLQNLYHSVLGDQRGLFPYLFRHTPILFTLVLSYFGATLLRGTQLPIVQTTDNGHEQETPTPPHFHTSTQAFLASWLILGWLTLSVISYSPSRYYLSTYPAMAGLAAISLLKLPSLVKALSQADSRTKLVRTGLVWLLAYHAIESVIHRDLLVSRPFTSVVLYATPTIVAVVLFRGSPILRWDQAWKPLLTCWAVINLAWLAHWGFTLDNTQYAACRWLAGNLPSGSVLIGDPAPGICLDNDLLTAPVIQNLCNTQKPLELFAGRPRYVAVVMDSPIKERFWNRQYPGVISSDLKVKTLHTLHWDIEVYLVPDGQWVK
jgi:4-amino-4-deoxy-L-arabinose transferase-like glycosyltransferase